MRNQGRRRDAAAFFIGGVCGLAWLKEKAGSPMASGLSSHQNP